MQILGTIGHVMRVSQRKTEILIGGLNRSSSKTNGSRKISLNLKAHRDVVLALTFEFLKFRHFFFSLFISPVYSFFFFSFYQRSTAP